MLTSVLSRVATALTYPLAPEDFLTVVDRRHSTRQRRGVVTGVEHHGADVATIRFRPGRGWLPPRAGQWLRVGVEIDGVRHWRPFSLSSAEGERPAITVGAVGLVSGALVRATRPGDPLYLDQPQGDFVLPAAPGPLLFLGAGTGLTPLRSMLVSLLARDPDADVTLLHLARTRADALFADELDALAAAHPRFRLLRRLSGTDGRLDLTAPSALDALVPDWRARAAYACGPEGVVADAEQAWAGASGLTVERFTPPRRVPAGTAGGRVTFARSARVVDAAGARPLLEAGEEAGVRLDSGCRMGICRTCLTRLDDGQVRDLGTGQVHGEPGDLIRLCVSAAAGDVRLDA